MIFTNIIIRSDITLYTEEVGIDVIIISIAQQRKLKSSPVRNSHRSIQTSSQFRPSQNISFLSKFLMNTIIRSILTLFTNFKHRHHSNFRTIAILKVIMDLQWTNSASLCRTIKSHWSLSDCVSRSQMGDPKTLTPGPRTPTTDRVRGLPTDRSMDYHYGPLYGPPPPKKKKKKQK